jgi:hypothetical protein
MMASDPRFDVYPNEVGEATKKRSKWTTCLIGCLAVLGVMMLLFIIAGVWVYRNGRGLLSDMSTQAITQMIDSSDLPPQEKDEVKLQVERVTKGFRDGSVSMEQVGTIVQKVVQSPLMPALVVAAIDKHYIEKSGLSNEEKTEGRVALTRFARGVIDKKIAEQGVDAVMTHVADRQPNGQWRLRQQVSDADLRAAMAEAKAQADAAGMPAEPEKIDPSEEFKRIIDGVMNPAAKVEVPAPKVEIPADNADKADK